MSFNREAYKARQWGCLTQPGKAEAQVSSAVSSLREEKLADNSPVTQHSSPGRSVASLRPPTVQGQTAPNSQASQLHPALSVVSSFKAHREETQASDVKPGRAETMFLEEWKAFSVQKERTALGALS